MHKLKEYWIVILFIIYWKNLIWIISFEITFLMKSKICFLNIYINNDSNLTKKFNVNHNLFDGI